MRTKLTDEGIRQLRCPEGRRRIEAVDWGGVPGLYLEVREASPGGGTYYLRYKDTTGKTCHQKLGTSGDMSLAEARRRAKLLRAEICLGADPRAESKAKRASLTFADFFEQHYLPYVTPRKRSWKRDEQLYRPRIKAVFGCKRLNQITRQQIQLFHTAVLEEGLAPATANHHVKLIKHSLNLAVGWQMLDVNPAVGVPLLLEDNQVENYLDEAELTRLLQVLRTDENRAVCRIALFLLSTGCRLNEALSARWEDIDVEKRVFVIRAKNSKSKRVRSVPLNESALEVLASLDTKGVSQEVFVNRRTGQAYTVITKVWHRIRAKAGLPKLRLHDLRHQYASNLVNGGRTLYEVQMILGHSDPKVTMRYAHLSSKALQEAAETASLPVQRGHTVSG
jgi:integrase